MNLTPVEQKDVWYLQKQIDEIIKNGLLDEDEIISFLDKYDIPEKMIRNQIKYTLNQRLSESNKKITFPRKHKVYGVIFYYNSISK